MRKKANRKLLFASVIFCFFGTHLKCVLCLFYSVIHFHLAQPKSEDKRQSTTPSDGVWCIPVVRVRCVHVNTYLLQDGICTCKLRCFSLTKWSKWNQMQRERERTEKITNTPPHQHTTADTFALSTHVKYEVEPSATHWILSKIYVNLIINMRVVSKW